MNVLNRLSLPLISGLLIALPVYWAYPENLTPGRNVAIVAGLVGVGLILAGLLTMLRPPRVTEWLGGLERLYRWHNVLGILAYLALLLHPLALAADSWEESPQQAWSALDPLQQGWPGWLGWAALLGLMVGVGVSLARRLPYDIWRASHWLLGLAVMLAVAHLAALGHTHPLLGLPILALAFMLWQALRGGGLNARPFIVDHVAHPAADSVDVRIKPLTLPIEADTGQFVLAAFGAGPDFKGCGEFHPYPLTGVRLDGQISLGIKALGSCTRQLQALNTGVAVRIQGPFGDFVSQDNVPPAIWLAGGAGIAPFIAKLRKGRLSSPTRLIYLYPDDAGAACLDELEELASHDAGLHLETRETGPRAPNLKAILPQASDLTGWHCHLCAPPSMLQAAVALLRARGVPDRHIHFEPFDFK